MKRDVVRLTYGWGKTNIDAKHVSGSHDEASAA